MAVGGAKGEKTPATGTVQRRVDPLSCHVWRAIAVDLQAPGDSDVDSPSTVVQSEG
jgi:hypothetical protein